MSARRSRTGEPSRVTPDEGVFAGTPAVRPLAADREATLASRESPPSPSRPDALTRHDVRVRVGGGERTVLSFDVARRGPVPRGSAEEIPHGPDRPRDGSRFRLVPAGEESVAESRRKDG